jgi:hypothetical protein
MLADVDPEGFPLHALRPGVRERQVDGLMALLLLPPARRVSEPDLLLRIVPATFLR